MSYVTSANADAASRNTAAGACSYPDGPAAVSSRRRVSGSGTQAAKQLAQHERQDAAVLVVVDLLGRVDAHARL